MKGDELDTAVLSEATVEIPDFIVRKSGQFRLQNADGLPLHVVGLSGSRRSIEDAVEGAAVCILDIVGHGS